MSGANGTGATSSKERPNALPTRARVAALCAPNAGASGRSVTLSAKAKESEYRSDLVPHLLYPHYPHYTHTILTLPTLPTLYSHYTHTILTLPTLPTLHSLHLSAEARSL